MWVFIYIWVLLFFYLCVCLYIPLPKYLFATLWGNSAKKAQIQGAEQGNNTHGCL